MLKAPGTKRLKLNYVELFFYVAFNFDLRPYVEVDPKTLETIRPCIFGKGLPMVRRCNLKSAQPMLTAPDFSA